MKPERIILGLVAIAALASVETTLITYNHHQLSFIGLLMLGLVGYNATESK